MYKEKHVIVNFRLTPDELNKLNERIKASEYNKQQFLRKLAIEQPVVNKSSLSEIITELRRQGINLNQISKSCNMGNVVQEIPQIKKTLEELNITWQFLRQLILKNTKPKE